MTSAVLDGLVITRPEEDPVVGLIVCGSADRVAAKLVDLDPQQQTVSQTWGLTIRLADERGEAAPFCDLWRRRQKSKQFFD